jgi:hypothetical protein
MRLSRIFISFSFHFGFSGVSIDGDDDTALLGQENQIFGHPHTYATYWTTMKMTRSRLVNGGSHTVSLRVRNAVFALYHFTYERTSHHVGLEASMAVCDSPQL